MTDTHLAALAAFVDDKRREHGFLRLNGAFAAADRGDALLTELEALLAALPEQDYSVAEAAVLTGMHPKSVYRRAKSSKLGHQTCKNGTIRLTEGDLRSLLPRKPRKEPVSAPAMAAAVHADSILATF